MSDTNELLRSKHAFGMEENIDSALQEGLIDAFDILFLKDANGNAKIGWIDKDGNKVIVEAGEVGEDDVVPVEALPESGEEGKIYIFGEDGYFWNGTGFVNLCKPTDLTELVKDVDALEAEVVNKADAEEVERSYEKIKYEITSVPVGTLVDYRDREIRVMCPADAIFTKQNVGAGGDANSFYCTFKTYAPNDDVVGYIEHLGDVVDSEILTDLKTDEYGRKYQPTWLALAKYDEATDTWIYHGANSTTDKYIGWDYQIDWYNADGVMIASDCIRINLSNEDCHSSLVDQSTIEAVNTAKTYTDEQIAAILNAYTVVEF